MRSVIARAPAAGEHIHLCYVVWCSRCASEREMPQPCVNVPPGTPQGGSEVAKVGMTCHHAHTDSFMGFRISTGLIVERSHL